MQTERTTAATTRGGLLALVSRDVDVARFLLTNLDAGRVRTTDVPRTPRRTQRDLKTSQRALRGL